MLASIIGGNLRIEYNKSWLLHVRNLTISLILAQSGHYNDRDVSPVQIPSRRIVLRDQFNLFA